MAVAMLFPFMAGMFVRMRTMLAGMLMLVPPGPFRVLVRMVVPMGMAMAVDMTMFVGMGRLAVVMRMAVAMLVFVAVLMGVFVIPFHKASSPVSSQRYLRLSTTIHISVQKTTPPGTRPVRCIVPIRRSSPS